jgi:hypothetical protein
MERTNPPIRKLSENLSSETLFTFTPKLEYLVDSLEFGLKPRYIFERLPIPNRTWYYIVAAKCFCDIPLGKIKSHLDWFGKYGVGIKKSFLRQKGASPVIYMHKQSSWIVNSLIEFGLENFVETPTLPFLKRHFGDDYRLDGNNAYKRHHRKFYDEREWRYIPENDKLETGNGFSRIEEGIEHVKQMNLINPFNKNIITLVPDNIEYLIIESDKEFKSLRSRLRNIYKSDEDFELMLSKILVSRKILRDF